MTLDDVERTLHARRPAHLRRATTHPVGIAGVMGGALERDQRHHHDVLLEMAWFQPWAVSRTSRRLGLRTEASARFEKGCDRGHPAGGGPLLRAGRRHLRRHRGPGRGRRARRAAGPADGAHPDGPGERPARHRSLRPQIHRGARPIGFAARRLLPSDGDEPDHDVPSRRGATTARSRSTSSTRCARH